MTERKKQLWLRPDQVDLLSAALIFVKGQIENRTGRLADPLDSMALRFTDRRLDEILKLLQVPQPGPRP